MDNPAIPEGVVPKTQKHYQDQIELQILIARHIEMNPGID